MSAKFGRYKTDNWVVRDLGFYSFILRACEWGRVKEAPQNHVKTMAQISEALITCQAGQENKVVLRAGLKVCVRNCLTLIFLPPVHADRQVSLSSHIKTEGLISGGEMESL